MVSRFLGHLEVITKANSWLTESYQSYLLKKCFSGLRTFFIGFSSELQSQ